MQRVNAATSSTRLLTSPRATPALSASVSDGVLAAKLADPALYKTFTDAAESIGEAWDSREFQ
ncbi:hypothetical protein LNQ52_19380 [Klebsiella pneumoniae subsp. pneumoniae]|nr:hypothetical protein [Klebsiella pneumoniae subsp. pneumoniae]